MQWNAKKEIVLTQCCGLGFFLRGLGVCLLFDFLFPPGDPKHPLFLLLQLHFKMLSKHSFLIKVIYFENLF